MFSNREDGGSSSVGPPVTGYCDREGTSESGAAGGLAPGVAKMVPESPQQWQERRSIAQRLRGQLAGFIF